LRLASPLPSESSRPFSQSFALPPKRLEQSYKTVGTNFGCSFNINTTQALAQERERKRETVYEKTNLSLTAPPERTPP